MEKGNQLVEIDWEIAGAILAGSDYELQSRFFKAFVKECQSWGTHFQIEKQLLSVAELLTSKEREILAIMSYPEVDNEPN